MDHFISNGCLSLQHSTPISILRGYHTPNLAFCVQFECQPWLILHCLTHEWLLHAFGGSSHLPHLSKEDYEPFQQQ